MLRKIAVIAALVASAGFVPPATAAPLECVDAGREELHYSWRLRGGLAWVAGIRFPTSGTGALTTAASGAKGIGSELMIRNSRNGDYYVYRSLIDAREARTLMTYHGYAFGQKSRNEKTSFDYARGIAHVRKQKKEKEEKVSSKVERLPEKELRDVLTGIYFLRQNAGILSAPLHSSIYSDGTLYPVVFRPGGTKSFDLDGRNVAAREFMITAAPGSEKRWPGGVKVWISDDERRLPLRIEIQRSVASLQLDLESIESCVRG